MTNSNASCIKAGIILAQDPTAKIICPNCLKDNLCVDDTRGLEDISIIERRIFCLHCEFCNYIRLNRPLK